MTAAINGLYTAAIHSRSSGRLQARPPFSTWARPGQNIPATAEQICAMRATYPALSAYRPISISIHGAKPRQLNPLATYLAVTAMRRKAGPGRADLNSGPVYQRHREF